MSRRPLLATAVVLMAVALSPATVGAAKPDPCAKWAPGGYCVEWTVGGNDGSPGDGGGGDGPAPICYWRNIGPSDDPTIFADYGLPYPPDGAEIQWQIVGVLRRHGSSTTSVGSSPCRQKTWPLVSGFASLDNSACRLSKRHRRSARRRSSVFRCSLPSATGRASSPTPVVAAGSASPSQPHRRSPSQPANRVARRSLARVRAQSSIVHHRQRARHRPPGACAHVYKLRTSAEGRPTEWPGSVSVTWSITWTATAGDSGTLPSITRTMALPRGVQEVQTVVVGGKTP